MSKQPMKPRFSAAKIKRMMQEDDDVGRIASDVPPLMSQSIELFAADLIKKAAAIAAKDESARKTVTVEHIKQCVEAEPLFDFLKGTVNAAHVPPPKRPRAAPKAAGSSSSGGGGAAAAAAAGGTSTTETAADHRLLAGEDEDYDADD